MFAKVISDLESLKDYLSNSEKPNVQDLISVFVHLIDYDFKRYAPDISVNFRTKPIAELVFLLDVEIGGKREMDYLSSNSTDGELRWKKDRVRFYRKRRLDICLLKILASLNDSMQWRAEWGMTL